MGTQPREQRPGLHLSATTSAEQPAAFTSHLQQVYQATGTQPREQRPGLHLQQQGGLVEQQLGDDPPVTTSEVIGSLKRLRFHKGGGTDRVCSNMLKRAWVSASRRHGIGCDEAAIWLAAFFNEC